MEATPGEARGIQETDVNAMPDEGVAVTQNEDTREGEEGRGSPDLRPDPISHDLDILPEEAAEDLEEFAEDLEKKNWKNDPV